MTEDRQKYKLCQGLCRDETGCLNKGKYKGYCWKHYKEPTIVLGKKFDGD